MTSRPAEKPVAKPKRAAVKRPAAGTEAAKKVSKAKPEVAAELPAAKAELGLLTAAAPAELLAAPPLPALLAGPTREQLIRQRAYALYESTGRVAGQDIDNWLTAEAQVDQRGLDGSSAAPAARDTPIA